MPAAGLSLTGKPPPSMSKAQYRAPKMYGMEAPVKPSVTVGGAPQPRTGVPRPTTAPAAAAAGGDGELQKEYIYNLQQQVYFLELQLKYLRDAPGGGGGTPGRPRSELVADAGPIDHSIDELRGSYLKIEDEYKAKLAAEELRQQQLREEALASATHERRTQEEKAKALAQLQLVRDTCSSEKQELQGEVTALQRELERCYLAEKTARAQFGGAILQRPAAQFSTPRNSNGRSLLPSFAGARGARAGDEAARGAEGVLGGRGHRGAAPQLEDRREGAELGDRGAAP